MRGSANAASTDHARQSLLETLRERYEEHGIEAVSTPYLEKTRLYYRLRAANMTHAVLLEELGLTAEYAAWRRSARTYRGKTKPQWTWDVAVSTAKKLVEREGDLPTVQWCRLNGYSQLTNVVHQSRRTWESLRDAVGSFSSSSFKQSRSGIRWLSGPEASLSNFLYARGIKHRKGELYGDGYAAKSGRKSGRFDMHILSQAGSWINVEVWGNLPDEISHGRYKTTRALKEQWLANDPNFLGIEYQDCLSDRKLTQILRPYIGVIEPFQFDKPTDRFIETAHWTDGYELLETCKEFAAQMPDGIFPSENWLRKRGKYVDRLGPSHNTLAIMVRKLLRGTRNVRKLLGHGHASTIQWTPESAIAAWRSFERTHGFTPSQANAGTLRKRSPRELGAEAGKIYAAVRLLGLLSEARNGRSARKIKWTSETAVAAWKDFHRRHGRTPSQCMGRAQRQKLPRAVTDEATNIYGAVRRLGLLTKVRGTSNER